MTDQQERLHKKLQALRKSYIESLPERLEAISRSAMRLLDKWDPAEADTLERSSHNLAGSGAIYGFPGISVLAKQLANLLLDLQRRETGPETHEVEQVHAYIQGIQSTIDEAVRDSNQGSLPGREDRVEEPVGNYLDRPRILLLERNASQKEQLHQILTRAQYDVIETSHLEDLAKIIHRHRPIAVLVDESLTEDSSVDNIQIQSIHELLPYKLPIIFVSQKCDMEARLAATRAGADRYFCFCKPTDSYKLINAIKSATEIQDNERFTIAIIDDDADAANSHAEILRDAGMQPAVITNPLESLETFNDTHADLILMASRVGGYDGIELANILRHERIMRGIPVIFLSDQQDPQKQIAAMLNGGDDFIITPVSPEYLVAIVRNRAKKACREIRNADLLTRTLRENQAQKTAMDQHAIISVADKRGIILSVNNKFCETSQYSRQELIGENHRILNSGFHPRAFFSHMWNTISSGRVWQGEIRNRRKDGSYYWVESTIMPLLDDTGRPYQYVSIRTDVTSIMEAEIEAKNRQQLSHDLRNITTRFLDKKTDDTVIFDHLLDMLLKNTESEYGFIGEVLYNEDSMPYLRTMAATDVSWNRETRELFDKARHDGLYFYNLDTLYGSVLNTGEIVVSNQPSTDPRSGGTPPGHPTIHAFLGVPVYYGNKMIAMFGIANRHGGYDRKTIDALEPISVTIGVIINAVRVETERSRTQKALQIAKDEAEMANRAKSDFLSSMSHELRTPLNAILGFAQLLEFDMESELSESQRENINHILKSGWHLLDLINEVLDLSRIETGKLTLSIEKVCLQDVVTECINLIEPLAQARSIRIHNEIPLEPLIRVRADITRLKQVLLNLMSNAVKYNRNQGSVCISAENISDDMVRIQVQDTGTGIPENQMHRLFQPFERLGNQKSDIEGTGIGLVITKRLIEQMQGTIGVESHTDKGSTFWFELPRLGDNETGASSEKGVPGATNGKDETLESIKLVLYVEDNPANLKLVQQLIDCRSNLQLISAHSAELGIELARGHRPDLIILDINLPGMDGYDALERLRSYPETGNTPVLALSANAMPQDIEQGLRAGFFDYLTKPINVQDFFSAIDRALE